MKVNLTIKRKKNSRDFIIKEAFKLFLQKNIKEVTVSDLEQVTGLQRGTIFYHFKDKKTLHIETINRYFFSNLNLFTPISPEHFSSFIEYVKVKESNLVYIMKWMRKEELTINPYFAFFHILSQVYLYDKKFKLRLLNLLKVDRLYWEKAAMLNMNMNEEILKKKFTGRYLQTFHIERCLNICCNWNSGITSDNEYHKLLELVISINV